MAKDVLGRYEDPRTGVLEERLTRLEQKLDETLERIRVLESHIENEEKKRRQGVITLTDTYRLEEPQA